MHLVFKKIPVIISETYTDSGDHAVYRSPSSPVIAVVLYTRRVYVLRQIKGVHLAAIEALHPRLRSNVYAYIE